ncbi:hypothetical protein RUM44_008533 [Polyplax serrata]|uniref:Uncharacterized protein n=1 Tax=Polyplax serrata TaxID=468196 RepID=A0ABR1B8I3_POLSC
MIDCFFDCQIASALAVSIAKRLEVPGMMGTFVVGSMGVLALFKAMSDYTPDCYYNERAPGQEHDSARQTMWLWRNTQKSSELVSPSLDYRGGYLTNHNAHTRLPLESSSLSSSPLLVST